MTTLNPYIKQYKKNQIETATPEQILILLYDGAINFLNKAKIALTEDNDEAYHSNLLKGKNIILEFTNTLDMKSGGNVARILYNLYRYMNRILTKADITKKEEGIDEVLKLLTNLRETWLKAIEISNTEKESRLVDKYEPSKSKTDESHDSDKISYAYEDEDEDEDDYEDDEEED